MGAGFIGVAALALAPILGWWLLALFVVAALNLATQERWMARSRRPERVVAASMALTTATSLIAVAGTGGPTSPLLPLLVLPAGMLGARFRRKVVLVGSGILAVTIVAIGVVVDPTEFVDEPALTIVTLALLGNVVAIALAIQGAELQHRTESVVDPLTGLLNRQALLARFAELEEQARISDGSLCMIVTDLDHFKHVNDEFGHERGDAVLRGAAVRMRRSLRSFELIYRLGGEEFLVVLPRVELGEGVRVAERLRSVIEEGRPGDMEITLSLGVAAARGVDVEYERLFAAADQALYAAKREGRNRVAWRHAGAATPRPVEIPTAEPIGS